jgi:hypothetical protein
LACSDGGRGCRSAVLRGDHHLRRGLVVWWSELCGAARDVVVVVWWSTWSELGRAARDVVDVVVVGARQSCSGRGRRGPWSELGGAARDVVDVVWWSTWSELGGAARSAARLA